MCNEAEPSAVSKIADFASFTLENFCGDLTEKAQKDGSRIELSPALIELMGMALYWIWVFDSGLARCSKAGRSIAGLRFGIEAVMAARRSAALA